MKLKPILEPLDRKTKAGNGGKDTSRNRLPLKSLTTNHNPIVHCKLSKTTIDISSNIHNIKGYKIYNLYGIIVREEDIKPTQNYTNTHTNLLQGLYIIKIQLENGLILTKKTILK